MILNCNNRNYQKTMKVIMDELYNALSCIDNNETEKFIHKIISAEKVFFAGVGRVLLSLQSIIKRLTHIGINAHYVGEISEPPIGKKDIIIIGSGSGSSLYPVFIAKKAKSLGAFVIHIGSNPDSELKLIADLMIRIPVRTKLLLDDEIDSCQPMTSLFEQSLLLFGDIVCKMIIEKKNINQKELVKYHANLE